MRTNKHREGERLTTLIAAAIFTLLFIFAFAISKGADSPKANAVAPKTAQLPKAVPCEAITAKGVQCGRKTRNNTKLCFQHNYVIQSKDSLGVVFMETEVYQRIKK